MNLLPTTVDHSSLDVFEKVSVLEQIQWSNEQQTFPTNSLNEASIDFQLETDRNIFIDLQEIYLLLKIRMKNGLQMMGADDEAAFVNNILHSLFSNCEVYFNNEQVYSSNGLYAHKALISTEFSGTKGVKESISYCHGYEYEPEPGDFQSAPIAGRFLDASSAIQTYYGKLAVDLFTCDKLLIPNTNVRIRLIRSRPNFYTLGKVEDNIHAEIVEASLFSRQVAVEEKCLRNIHQGLLREPARYNFSEVLGKTFIIPNGQNQYIQENIFNNAPIRRLALAMNTNTAFTGSRDSNPFHYQKFGLREIKLVRGNQVVVNIDTSDDIRAFVTTMKALKFDEDGPGVPFSDYHNHYVLVFDLTSTQESNVHMFYPDVVGAGLRLELYFSRNLINTVEVIVLGERLSTVFIDKNGAIAKNG